MTILTKGLITVETEPVQEGKATPFLNETMVREVLFSERNRSEVPKQPKEMTAAKTFLKTLIMEAWDELV